MITIVTMMRMIIMRMIVMRMIIMSMMIDDDKLWMAIIMLPLSH